MFSKPNFRSVSAARALVSSAGQLQYVTNGRLSARKRATEASTVSRGISTALGISPVANEGSSRTSMMVTPEASSLVNSAIEIRRSELRHSSGDGVLTLDAVVVAGEAPPLAPLGVSVIIHSNWVPRKVNGSSRPIIRSPAAPAS